MKFVGIDVSTSSIDVVFLDENTDDADFHRFALKIGPGDYHESARRIPQILPARGAWRDMGAVLIAIELPMTAPGHGGFQAAVPQAVIRGALLACLPKHDDVPVALMPAHLWKKWSLGGGFPGKGQAKKPEIAEWAKATWTNRSTSDQNLLDAFCIAYAARRLHSHAPELLKAAA